MRFSTCPLFVTIIATAVSLERGTIENRLTRCLWTSGPKSMEVYDVSSDKMLADFRIICSTSTSRSLKLIEFVECP